MKCFLSTQSYTQILTLVFCIWLCGKWYRKGKHFNGKLMEFDARHIGRPDFIVFNNLIDCFFLRQLCYRNRLILTDLYFISLFLRKKMGKIREFFKIWFYSITGPLTDLTTPIPHSDLTWPRSVCAQIKIDIKNCWKYSKIVFRISIHFH